MSIWSSIGAAVQGLGSAGAQLLERGFDAIGGNDDMRRSVRFTMAIVALAAKMAKADGVVTPEEADAVWMRLDVPAAEQRNVRWLFTIAQQDVHGYQAYARRIAKLFADDPAMLADILDVLFTIAAADGFVHEREEAFLEDVAAIFGTEPTVFRQIRARHVRVDGSDPYAVLGVDPALPLDELKRRYRELVVEHHPDRLLARGVPADFIRIANDRLAAINMAWEQIERERRERP